MTTKNVLKETLSKSDVETLVFVNSDVWLSLIERHEGEPQEVIEAARRIIRGTYNMPMANAVIRSLEYRLGINGAPTKH